MFCSIYILTGIFFGNFQVFRFSVLLFNCWDSKQQIISNSRYKQFAFKSICLYWWQLSQCWINRIRPLKLLYFVLLTKIWRLTLIQPFEPLRFYVGEGFRVWSNRTQFTTSTCSASLYHCQELFHKNAGSLIWANPWTWIFPREKREDLLPDDSMFYVKEKNCIKESCLEKLCLFFLLLFLVLHTWLA